MNEDEKDAKNAPLVAVANAALTASYSDDSIGEATKIHS